MIVICHFVFIAAIFRIAFGRVMMMKMKKPLEKKHRQKTAEHPFDGTIQRSQLFARIRQKMESATDKQVYLRGDGDVLYQDLMEVFDRLKGAGVERVGLVAKLPGER